MEIHNEGIYQAASEILRQLYGPNATFRDGQYEAIEATMLNRRTLVVQRTGWGKSLVYFTCTKLLRSQGKGVTVVVSPLLALMENQIAAAKQLGLRCDCLNSRTRDRRESILRAMIDQSLDLVLVTPETLFTEAVQGQLGNLKIGLFVIDEAHCISDWGHDFRLEYSRLKEVIGRLPHNVPVLGTTATANDRVVQDLKTQLGEQMFISRGPLARDSLWIQVLQLPGKADRYAWILQNIGKLPGSGIIYCLTQRDCDYLTDFLNKNGVSAMSYYARTEAEEDKNQQAEQLFRENRIKVLVATVKLGMGYDKGDIAFVIHFQMPSNIVSYYQQIGRAGRNIDQAYIFLMCGQEDEDIINYFISTAFPTERESGQIMDHIQNHNGCGVNELAAALNIRRSRMEKALAFLLKDGFLFKSNGKYYISPKPFVYDGDHYKSISKIRYREVEQMRGLVQTGECYSQYIVNALDDYTAPKCGHCANCLGHPLLPEQVSFEDRQKASEYVNGMIIKIEPRKQWPLGMAEPHGRIRYVNQEGICLSKYGDPGYGELVRRDKYAAHPRFCDELVGRSVQLLRALIQEKGITHITCVPSLRSPIVKEFAQRAAAGCQLPFVELLQRTGAFQQKSMENSAHQCMNAYRSFSVIPGVKMPKRVLLIDDMVDSRWTLTVCGFRLMECGCGEVYPFALADSSQREGGE